jgi:hypothetical protein
MGLPRCSTVVLHRQNPAVRELPDFEGLFRYRKSVAEREGFEPPFYLWASNARILHSNGWATLAANLSDYFCLQRTSDLRVSIVALATAVASESPSRIRPTRSGDSQARWIRLLT